MGDLVSFPGQKYQHLEALPETLRERVLGYGARKIHEIEQAIDASLPAHIEAHENLSQAVNAIDGVEAHLPQTLTLKGENAIQMAKLLLVAQPRDLAELERISHIAGLQHAGNMLLKDERLGVIASELNAHYQGNIPPNLANEVYDYLSVLKQQKPNEFSALVEMKIMPAVGEAAEQAANFLSHFKRPAPLAFGAVSCVALGACCHALLTPQLDTRVRA